MSASPSDARESLQSFFGSGHEDTMADQEANRHGRGGKDPITTDLLPCLTNTEHPPITSGGCAVGPGTQPEFFSLVPTAFIRLHIIGVQ